MDVNAKTQAVNETLKLPLADEFERDLTAVLDDADGVSSLVLAMIDLDHFMRVNTEFNRRVGDAVLIQTGEYLKSRLPEGAKLYRYGGDEFAAVFFDGYEKEDVFLLMEQIRRDYDVALPDGTKQMITIGIAAGFDDASRYAELVRKAEGAMFRGKTAGKNRVCLAREEKMVTKTSHFTVDQLQRLTKLSKREGLGEAIFLREALDALLKKYDV